MILIRAGLTPRSSEQTLIHEMAHAKLSWIRKEVHGKRFTSELIRLRKLGAPLSSFELDKVGSEDASSREPEKLTKKKVRALISEALGKEGLSPKLVPRYLEQELMIPYSAIKRLLDVRREIEVLTLKKQASR